MAGSITMAELASKYAKAGQNVPGVTEDKIAALAQVGVGYVKTEIQNMHAVDTGTMLNSTTSEKQGATSYLIGPTVDYAVFVALGTSRVAARPFHKVAAKRLQGAVNQGNILRDLGLA